VSTQGTPRQSAQPASLGFLGGTLPRPYDVVFRLTHQMLAIRNVEDGLSLVLDACVAEFGFQQAAIALVEGDSEELRIKLGIGFPEDRPLVGVAIPLNLGAPFCMTRTGGEASWIQRITSVDKQFLDQIGSASDLLALPLYGEQSIAEQIRLDGTSAHGRDGAATLAAAGRIGAMYVASDPSGVSRETLGLLRGLADRVGLSLSIAKEHEHLTATMHRLEREREWVNAITQSVADPIVLTDLDNQILLQNRRAEELFSGSGDASASDGKIRALKMNDLLFSAYLSSVGFSVAGPSTRDLTLVDPIEGSDVHFEVVSTPALDASGQRIGLVSAFRDVTDLRKANDEMVLNLVRFQQAEAEARHERDRLNLIIENVGHPVVVSDGNGNLIRFNRRAQSFFDVQDPSPAALASVRSNSVKLTSFISALASDPYAQRQTELELIDSITGEILPMEITSVEVHGPRGQVTAVVSILHDLSSIRELERRRLQQQLFESEKLAAIGRLTASIAHEINNPLEAVKNSLYLLRGGEQSNNRFLEIALKEIERVSHVIGQMLGFARGTGRIEWANVNDLLEETLVLLEKRFKQSGTKVVRDYAPELPQIHARADQLKQVFLNLLLNAQQAMGGKGQITIRTAALAGAVQPSLFVEISDTGSGISDEDLTRIFEPFFSTRKKGSGLGLWVTQDIVRHHGGRIEVSSTVNRGTTFRIVLPIEPPQPERMQPPATLSA
jgi:PAS domain S-box-containing protein